MKCRDLADILRLHADTFALTGARSEQASLQSLASALERTPTAAVAAFLKRASTASPPPGPRPTLGDVARLLAPLSRLIRVAGKATAATDLETLADFLGQRPSWPLSALTDLPATPVRATKGGGSRKPAAAMREPLVAEFLQQLRATQADPARFASVVNALGQLTLPELKKLAKEFSGASGTSKAAALKNITAHHQYKLGVRDRSAATGGRSAA
jgi:hypothetical protein